jgi:hypothetical protein
LQRRFVEDESLRAEIERLFKELQKYVNNEYN